MAISDYTLYKVLDENGFETTPDNLDCLKRNLEEQKVIIFDVSKIPLNEGLSDHDAIAQILGCPLFGSAKDVKFKVNERNIGIIKENLDKGNVLLFNEDDAEAVAPAAKDAAADTTAVATATDATKAADAKAADAADAPKDAAKADAKAVDLDTTGMDDDHAKNIAVITYKNCLAKGYDADKSAKAAKRVYSMIAARDKKRATVVHEEDDSIATAVVSGMDAAKEPDGDEMTGGKGDKDGDEAATAADQIGCWIKDENEAITGYTNGLASFEKFGLDADKLAKVKDVVGKIIDDEKGHIEQLKKLASDIGVLLK